MVKLRQGSNVLDTELNTYFDYNNNFSQLLEDYLLSGDIERKFNRSKCNSKAKFIYNKRATLTKKYKDGDDIDSTMKKWMEDRYETKAAHIKPDQSKLIEELLTRVAKLETEIAKLKAATSLPVPSESIYGSPLPQEEANEEPCADSDSDSDSPVIDDKETEDIETQEEFIENRNTENRTKKQLKDNAYQMEINYLNSFDNSLQEFPNLIEEYSEGELDIEEVKEELGFVYELKLDKLAEDPLVNITRLKNKTKNHIECLIDKIENL
tara:strand:- start:588 stop:1388 length:801 start_codon:yes stop_codon:yes gene_type:complete